MTLRVIGAGVGRTGTLSLKLALERLFGAPCYHMSEVFTRPDHVAQWHAAARGEPVDWRALLAGYGAVVDWPAASFWPELAAAFPDALIVLSTRSAESWWESASRTIFTLSEKAAGSPWHAMWRAVTESRFTARTDDRAAALAAYERHNAEVRARAPRARLLEWTARDGWAPLCRALGAPVPSEPFPHANSTEEFLGRFAGGARP